MLSVKPIKNADVATEYFFVKDNLYGKDIPENKAIWWGKGARILNLTGQVRREDFQNLLEGKLAPDVHLGRWLNGEIAHRAGFDLTFSAPKSFSILTEVYGFEFLTHVHNRAVKQTLDYIESECSQARITKEGKTKYHDTDNLVVALFEHDTSRSLDPHVHSHAVIINATFCNDNKWRSLSSQSPNQDMSDRNNGFYEQILERQRHYGTVYRANLAYILKQEYGYQLYQTHLDGRFEISGVDPVLIKHFSKRREAIEDFLTNRNLSGARAASFAALETRDVKLSVNHDELRKEWQQQASKLGFDPKQVDDILKEYRTSPIFDPKNLSIDKSSITAAPLDTAVGKIKQFTDKVFERLLGISLRQLRDEKNNDNALRYAIEYLSENNVILSETQLVNVALTHDIGNVCPHSILQAINRAKQTGDLIRLDKPGQVTTPELLNYERELIKILDRGLDNGAPLGYSSEVNAFVETQSQLIAEQQFALAGLLKSTNRLQGLLGAVGSGKSEIIKTLAQFSQQQGFTTIGLTTSTHASRDLKQQLSIPTQTITGYIKQSQARWKYSKSQFEDQKTLIILDNANLASSRQLFELVQWCEKINAHLIMVGDKHAPLPAQAGNPLLQLIERGLPQFQLNHLHRGQKQAISAKLAGDIKAAFDKLGERIISIDDYNTRLHAIAYQAAHSPSALVLLPTIAERDNVNLLIHDQLKRLGQLNSKGQMMDVLVPCYLKQAQYRLAKNYQENQILRLNQTTTALGIQKDDYYVITGKDLSKNELILLDNQCNRITWQPNSINRQRQGIAQLYNQEKREINLGEHIRWTQNSEAHGLYNGIVAKVIAIDKNQLTLALEDKEPKLVTLSQKDLASQHFDYAYATTYFKGYHHVAEAIITHQASKGFSTHQRNFYRQLGQATKKIFLYTDNRKAYLQTIQKQTGDKITAIDTLLHTTHDLPTTRLEAAIKERLQASSEYRDTPEEQARSAVTFAIAHLSEREAVFDNELLYEKAMEYGFGEINTPLIEAAIKSCVDKGELVRCSTEDFWTTKEAIETEKEILRLAEAGLGKVKPIANKSSLAEYFSGTILSDEQKKAALLITTTTDRFIQIQGYAGTGKTALLKTVQTICNDNNFKIVGIAATYSAVKEMQKQNIPARTLESYLNETTQQLPFVDSNQTLLVLDEASMVSNSKFHTLQKLVIESGGRLLAVGDRKQLGSFGAGKPFELVQQSKAKTAVLQQVKRQKDPVLKKAVDTIIKNDYASAIQQLSKNIKEEEIRSKRLELLAGNYLARPASLRERTLVITPANKDREVVNSLIREGLKDEGLIYGKDLKAQILIPKVLTKAEYTLARHYEPGNFVRFNIGSKILGIENNSYFRVNSHNLTHNAVMLADVETGKRITWLPHEILGGRTNATEIYQADQIELNVGDKLHWTRADKTKGLTGLTLATIKEIKEGKVTVQLANKKSYSFSVSDIKEQHIDYAYAITVFRAQGKTEIEIICHEDSQHEYLTNQRGFYVSVTRAIQNVTIYTDSKRELIKRILANTGDKTSALEALNQLKAKDLTKRIITTTKKQLTKFESHKETQQNPAISKQEWQSLFQAMSYQAESIVKEVLGEPNSALSNKTSWRYGKKGSLAISLDGDKRGLWHNFETGEKGNLFQLLQKHTGLSKQNLYKHYANRIGLTGNIQRSNPVRTKLIKKAKTSIGSLPLTDEQKKRIAYANKLVRQSLDIRGTLAERYLKEHRGIKKDIPESFRFHPNLFSKINNQACPALLVIAKNLKGEIQAVQAIYLDSKTANKADVNVQKQTFGVIKNALVEIHQSSNPTDFILVAEGPETGLSLREAILDMNIKVSLSISNFSSIVANVKEKNVVLCLDNDGMNAATAKLIDHSSKLLTDVGKNVWLNKPKEIDKDYNDILREQGRKAVYNYIQNSFQYRENNQSRINLKDYTHNIYLTISNKPEKNKLDFSSNKFRQHNANLGSQVDVNKTSIKVKDLDEI